MIDFRHITEERSSNILQKFGESKGIARIYRVPYNHQHQGVVEVFNRIVQNIFISEENYIKGKI